MRLTYSYGANDNASDYGISENMRAKIRGLEQDIKNVQNGSSILNTALGGIQSIVDELRELKELAIDSANDSNTNADRATMQKVLKQKQANIDDIATNTNFNTKSILDGTYSKPHWEEKYLVQYTGTPSPLIDWNPNGVEVDDTDSYKMKATTLRKVDQSNINIDNDASDYLVRSDLANRSLNIDVLQKNNMNVKNLASAFTAMGNGITFADGTRAVETKETALYSRRPEDIEAASEKYIVPNYNFIRSTGGAPIAVKMDFSGAIGPEGAIFDSNGYADGYNISQLDKQGFSILFSDSSQYVSIKFATELENVSGNCALRFYNSWTNYSNTGDIEYTIKLNEDLIRNGTTQEDFAKYVFDSIKDCQDRISIFDANNNHDKVELYDLRFGDGNFITENDYNFALSQKFNVGMAKDDAGNVYITMLQPYSHSLGILDDGALQEKFININGKYSKVAERYEYKAYEGDSLWIQHGTKAGQHMNIFINDMHNAALGTDAADVTTKDRAIASIDYIDVAIEYALDEATNVGAYLQRMEYTEANVTNESENAQSSESTIRDADMAKEMVEYTKYNVISQASQAMLAQANQSMSSVLSLLQ